MFQESRQTWSDADRQRHQAERFDGMVEEIRRANPFYQRKWGSLKEKQLNYEHLESFPLTTKKELQEDQQRTPPFGTNLTNPFADYIRLHQTSGTTGTPLRVLDTAESWGWWAECWQYILDAAGVTREDVVMPAFSFGPFVGFWSAQEALAHYGALMVPGGGMDSAQRLAVMAEAGVTVLLCTPSYAIHLAQVGLAQGIDPAKKLKVRTTIHAGEPGASIPATRERIETLWGATSFDHPGASEIGAFGFSCSARTGVHVNEAEFIAEVIDPDSGRPVASGEAGELVLTIRGVNVFPSAFQEILNRLPGVVEHRITAYRRGEMDELHVEIECENTADRRSEAGRAIRDALGIRVSLAQCPPDTLPRFELKARRFFDRRNEGWLPEGELPS